MKLLRHFDAIFIKMLKNKKFSFLTKIMSHLGSFIFVACFVALLFLCPYQGLRRVSVICMASLVINTAVVFVIKNTVKRRRRIEFNGFKYKIDPFSFPSGHISRLSGFLMPTITVLPLFCVVCVLIVASWYARMVGRFHYFSDCFVGFIIGFGGGVLAVFLSRYIPEVLIF